MNREEFIGKLQLVYAGDKRASKDIISEYDRLNNIINEVIYFLELDMAGTACLIKDNKHIITTIVDYAKDKKHYRKIFENILEENK